MRVQEPPKMEVPRKSDDGSYRTGVVSDKGVKYTVETFPGGMTHITGPGGMLCLHMTKEDALTEHLMQVQFAKSDLGKKK